MSGSPRCSFFGTRQACHRRGPSSWQSDPSVWLVFSLSPPWALAGTNTFPTSRHVGPSPTVVSDPSLVQELVALVNAIPIFEDKGAEFSCPSEKPGETSGTFAVRFGEQPGAPALATLEDQPYACGDSFLPI